MTSGSTSKESTVSPVGPSLWRLLALVLTVVTVGAFGAEIASAEFGIRPDPKDPTKPFVADSYADAAESSPQTQSGAAPYQATTVFSIERKADEIFPQGLAKDIEVDLPAGFVGNPQATSQCSRADFNRQTFNNSFCSKESQVGFVDLALAGTSGEGQFIVGTERVPVFNVAPMGSDVASFGFRVIATNIQVRAQVRPSDNRVTAFIRNIPDTLPLLRSRLTLWGTPAHSRHDTMRRLWCSYPGEVGPNGDPCFRDGAPAFRDGGLLFAPEPLPSNAPRVAFLRNPTSCGHLAVTGLRIRSWQDPSDWKAYETTSSGPGTGCDQLTWSPGIGVRPDTTRAGAPVGLTVDLDVPQTQEPDRLATPHVDDVVVRLPEGMTVSPSSAGGLDACSGEQLGAGRDSEPGCPPSSKIGDVSVSTPVLAQPLKGSVYVGTQTPQQLIRLFIVARGPGVLVKIAGKVDPDPTTGRLTATFADNPQLPFERLSVRFKGGPRAPVSNPSTCGEKVATADLTSWGGQAAAPASAFAISGDGNGSACPAPRFTPSFVAGTANPVGGIFSAMTVGFAREDADQHFGRISLSMPEGLLARVAAVPNRCADADADAGTCDERARIGTLTAAAGPGPNPFQLPGRVYLTGPYKGGPFGLSIVVPAIAGPFDLGLVVVRAAIHVDPRTAAVRVISDPLPTILEGIPLQIRLVDVKVDRPGFMMNPSSCSEKRINATLASTGGAVHRTGSRFQVGDCRALPFTPRLALRLTGRKQIRTGRHPGVKAVVRQKGIGEAGINRAKVVLPKSLALDPENAQALCEFVDGTKPDLEDHCPRGSIVGRARAKTPLLSKDLVGNVYFVKNVKIDRRTGNRIRTLPMIVVALRGEIAINLTGKSATAKDGRLINTFASVPDAPISRFNLNIAGGKTGILAVTRTRKAKINLCANPNSHHAVNRMTGQNGKRADYRVRVKTPCANKSKKTGKSKQAKRGSVR